MNIVVAHEVWTCLYGAMLQGRRLGGCLSEIEQYHLGLFAPGYRYTVIVSILYQHIVGIDKLQISACGHLYARVTCLAQSHIALTDISDIVFVSGQFVSATSLRPIVDNDNLALISLQR
jgi:hypothetical protein